MARLQLCIFHYHLLPGGVTDVIMGWVRILACYSAEIFPQYEEIALRICCGNPELQLQDFGSRFASLEFVIDKELGYQSETALDASYVEKLAEHLLQQYKAEGWDNLWWIHNYHLGKNVGYTQALLHILQQDGLPNLRFLLHIHDFPECGRLALYQDLLQAQHCLGGTDSVAKLYPVASNICYGTINQRDFQILRNAGLPEERLFFLPNPLDLRDVQEFGLENSKVLRAEFNQKFGLPDTILALYPVRCIRRKNVLELALLNLLTTEPWNLVCTLPGCSEAEQPYSQMVEDLYRDGIIQGRCHVAWELEAQGWSFGLLCQAADLIVSSSVMEGFGFTYFHPMYWGKALLARYLDVLQGFEHCFEPEMALFYRELKIPLYRIDGTVDKELAELYGKLRQRYENYAAQFPVGSALLRELSLASQLPEYLDFALLSVAQQRQLLLRLHRDKLRGTRSPLLAACRQANADLLKHIDALVSPKREVQQRSRQRIATEFAPQHLAGILQRACAASLPEDPKQNFEQDDSKQACEAAISHKILQAFSKLEYNYAILWDKGDNN